MLNMLLLSLRCRSKITRAPAQYFNQPAPIYFNHAGLSLNPFSAGGGDPSLSDVYDNMNPPLTREEWHVHDPSHVLETDGILMVAVTGKAQENGYK